MQLNFLKLDYTFENDYLELCIYEEASLICVVWRKHTQSEELRAGFMRGLQEANSRNLKYWLSDTRQINYAEVADQKWVMEVGGQLVAEGSLLKVAHVVYDDSIRMLVAYKIADQIKELYPNCKTQFEIFTEPEKALSWLEV